MHSSKVNIIVNINVNIMLILIFLITILCTNMILVPILFLLVPI